MRFVSGVETVKHAYRKKQSVLHSLQKSVSSCEGARHKNPVFERESLSSPESIKELNSIFFCGRIVITTLLCSEKQNGETIHVQGVKMILRLTKTVHWCALSETENMYMSRWRRKSQTKGKKTPLFSTSHCVSRLSFPSPVIIRRQWVSGKLAGEPPCCACSHSSGSIFVLPVHWKNANLFSFSGVFPCMLSLHRDHRASINPSVKVSVLRLYFLNRLYSRLSDSTIPQGQTYSRTWLPSKTMQRVGGGVWLYIWNGRVQRVPPVQLKGGQSTRWQRVNVRWWPPCHMHVC